MHCWAFAKALPVPLPEEAARRHEQQCESVKPRRAASSGLYWIIALDGRAADELDSGLLPQLGEALSRRSYESVSRCGSPEALTVVFRERPLDRIQRVHRAT